MQDQRSVISGLSLGTSSGSTTLEDASYEELAAAVSERIAEDRQKTAQQLETIAAAELRLKESEAAAELRLQERQTALEEMERRIFAITDNADEVVELNVGGQPMSTTRAVLCSAEGSLLAGMFSGSFDAGHKRDKENRIFLDVDPPLFGKVLSHLRLRRIASPDCPAPLPHVPEELRPEYDMLVKYFGLESFLYGDIGTSSASIFKTLAEMHGVCQSKLQTHDIIKIALSSTGGVPATNHEEVLGLSGFHERSLENSYGTHPTTITIKFHKNRVRVEGMELRAKVADIVAHMSNQWTFRHGNDTISMQYSFSRQEPSTGKLESTGIGPSFTDEVVWTFPRDFCLEHIVLYGRVMTK